MLRLTGIKLPSNTDFSDIRSICAKELKSNKSNILLAKLVKKSLDARKKGQIHWVCNIDFSINVNEKEFISKYRSKKLAFAADRNFWDDTLIEKNTAISSKSSIVVVGSGPAGLFCALILSKNGLNPILIERGDCVEKRTQKVNAFWNTGNFDLTTNVQFGEGGAGTFSDGKLNTGIKDPRCRFVLEEFANHGAGEEILYDAKPHIGSDRLIGTVKGIREEIIKNGGQVLFNHRLCDISVKNNNIAGITVDSPSGKIKFPCENLVLALGHSARDTFEMLFKKGINMIQKPFAVGVRAEHPQELINISQYGENYDKDSLPPADYKLSTHLSNGRGVYTFCMCPGGQVVAAASEQGSVCTNGMSLSARNGKNANSAILVNVTPEDFKDDHPLSGMYFQRKIEKAAFEAAGRDYSAPIQLLGDFLGNKPSSKIGNTVPSYKPSVKFVRLEEYLPGFVTDSLRTGIPELAKKLHGFDLYDAVLTGPETRSSSPIRMVRNENCVSNIGGIYPCGEGAGYAGGIMSAAVDGIRIAEAVVKNIKEGI